MAEPGTAPAAPSWADLVARLTEVSHDDLPEEALDSAGRVLADSILCARAAAGLERSRVSQALLASEAGAREARIFGTRLRVPARAAAYANGEAMNLLDADDTLFNVAHFGGPVAAAATAEAERTGADWDRVRRAMLLGFELNARLTLSHRPEPGMMAPGLMIVGAALAAAVAGGLPPERWREAVGLALRTAPTATSRDVSLARVTSFKYAPYGMIASEAVMAARLAGHGYRSPIELLDAFPGFAQVQRVSRTAPGPAMISELGWWIRETSLKPFPTFRVGQTTLDCVDRLVRENDIAAASVGRIELFLDPRALRLPFVEAPSLNDVDPMHLPMATFSDMRLSAALLALRVPPGPAWVDRSTLLSEPVLALRERVVLMPHPAGGDEALAARRDAVTGLPRIAFGGARIRSGAVTYERSAEDCSGDPWSADAPPDWGWLEEKSRNFIGSPSFVRVLRRASGAQKFAVLAI